MSKLNLRRSLVLGATALALGGAATGVAARRLGGGDQRDRLVLRVAGQFSVSPRHIGRDSGPR